MAKIVQLKDTLSKENLYPTTLASEVIKGGTSIVPSLLPEGGTVGDILSNNGKSNFWENISDMFQGIEELLYYGVEIDSTISDPHLTRIGNMDLHRSLPIQSKMRGCLLSDTGEVVEYLPEDDWTSSVRDGSKGQVMVEVPDHYRKFITEGTKYRALISEYPLKGFHKVNKFYISAYEASLQRSTLKLASVVNTDADYRGGNNNTEWDSEWRSLLGRPITYKGGKYLREYARNRNNGDTQWNKLTYYQYCSIYWLFTIEYANLNCQEDYNQELTSEGFKQGGFGIGVGSTDNLNFQNYNSNCPFIPCGHTDTLGNKSGIKEYIVEVGDISETFQVPRYRGIELPFSHICKNCDGILAVASKTVDAGGDGLVHIYVCDNPEQFSSTVTSNYRYIGPIPTRSAWIKTIYGGEFGDIVPKEVGAQQYTYFCDLITVPVIKDYEVTYPIDFGGNAWKGSDKGMLFMVIAYVDTSLPTGYGTRLCYIPKIN